MKTCPRCRGASNIICCALCKDKREVSDEAWTEYRYRCDINGQPLTVSETLLLRQDYEMVLTRRS